MKDTRRLAPLLLAPALAAAAVAGCSKTQDAPTDVGVCYHAVFLKDGAIRFNKLASDQKQLENCAAALEAMRIRFRVLGGPEQIVGAYQGQYLFVQSEGIFTSSSLTGGRYIALVRSGDGRLVIPGAVRQAH